MEIKYGVSEWGIGNSANSVKKFKYWVVIRAGHSS